MPQTRVAQKLKKSYDLERHAPLYRARMISAIKAARARGRDLAPSALDFGPVRFYLARHFGFCKGVENAIEMAYEMLDRAEGRRVFMLSELIHNAFVNDDLRARGLTFVKSSKGEWFSNPETGVLYRDELRPDDVVIIPAFGATVEDKAHLASVGVDVSVCDATCWFVENVWLKAEELGRKGFSIIIHGKFNHEETQATFSYARQFGPAIVVRDLAHAKRLGRFILGETGVADFNREFGGQCSEGFDADRDLQKVAVVNQTTMLSSETEAIADYMRDVMRAKHGESDLSEHFADTKNTLCYATNNNQGAAQKMLEHSADLALVIGGRNSSNTSHLVELAEERVPTYFIQSERDLESADRLRHYDFRAQTELFSENYLPAKRPVSVMLTAGASCPDAIVERVMTRLLSFFPNARDPEAVLKDFLTEQEAV